MEHVGATYEPDRRRPDRRRPGRRACAGAGPFPAPIRARVDEPEDASARHRGRAGFADAVVDDDLREWDYGELEGVTTPDIRGRGGAFSDWTIWRGPVPGGETIEQVAARTRRVLERVAAAGGDVLCFGHGHASRVLVAVALELDPHAGARFVLDPATISIVGSEHDERALRTWNARV